jgi:hypothetical protein
MRTQDLLADCFTEDALAAEANISKRTIARYRNEPDGLPYFRLGGRIYIRRTDWSAFVERRIIRPNPTREGRRATA